MLGEHFGACGRLDVRAPFLYSFEYAYACVNTLNDFETFRILEASKQFKNISGQAKFGSSAQYSLKQR